MLTAVLLCAVAWDASAGQVYRWVDANGRAHYSDTPQAGWEPVDIKSANTVPGVPSPRPEGAGSYTGEQQVARDQLRASECKRRQEQLDSYLKATRIVERDSSGEEKVYTETQRLKLIELTERQVAELCGSGE